MWAKFDEDPPLVAIIFQTGMNQEENKRQNHSSISISRTQDCANPLDRLIREDHLAWGIHVLSCISKQSPLFALSHYVSDHDVTTRTLFFQRRQSHVLPP